MIPSVGILDLAMLHRMGLLFHCQPTGNASTVATGADCISSTLPRFSGSAERVLHVGNL